MYKISKFWVTKKCERAVPASLMRIAEKLKRDEINQTSSELATKSSSVNGTQFYGIFEEIFLALPARLENLETGLKVI